MTTNTDFDLRERRLNECFVIQQHIERLELSGPHHKIIAATEQLAREGYRVLRTGPYTDREMYPRLDHTRFMIVAERIVKTKKFKG